MSLGCRITEGTAFAGSCLWSSNRRFRFLEGASVGFRIVFWKVSQFCDGLNGFFTASCEVDMMGRSKYVDIRVNRWPIKQPEKFRQKAF